MTATAQSSIIPRVLTDAVRVVIPVKRFITPETLAGAGMVMTQSLSIPITLPATVQSDAELVVKLEGSLAAGMVDGLQYLEHYPYECNEQSLSRFLPNLFTVRTFRSLGLADAAMERQLNYQLVVGTQRMISRQNPDGGWAIGLATKAPRLPRPMFCGGYTMPATLATRSTQSYSVWALPTWSNAITNWTGPSYGR